ncbi:MAG TPA: CDP-diacylglycerol--glycerol-3-phosphate 3-phosphatidyltransferase [Candidatus Micrarchaeia archaeon]|nr:CDP-diacylglycerol--glycerol-3-phosphate 3-phosphatidyltransferase [Candidatus Micrarchaeia archaeon]
MSQLGPPASPPAVRGAASRAAAAPQPEGPGDRAATAPVATEVLGVPAVRRVQLRRRLTLPNSLTLVRLLAIPVLLWVLAAGFAGHDQVAAAVFLLAAATDTLDGWVARRRRQVTALGIFLDPLADKLLVIAVLFALVGSGRVAPWVGFVIVARELLVTVLRSRASGALVSIAASPLGKLKTLTQVAMVLAAILLGPYPGLGSAAEALVALAVTATLVSGADYVWRYRQHLL